MALEETDTADPELDEQTRTRRAFEPGGGITPAEARPDVIPSAQPGQQQGDPNAPGGPPPDPASFRLSPTNPSRGLQIAEATPISPVDASQTDWNTRPFGPNIYRRPDGGGPTAWGKDWWPIKTAESYPGPDIGNPNVPNPLESYPVSSRASAQLAKYAPPDVAQPAMQGNLLMNPISAIADAFSKGKFSQNFSASYMRGLEIQREEALQHYEQAIAAYREHMLVYGKILSQASVSKDPNRFEIAKQALIEYATGRDPDIIEILKHGDLKAVETHLNNQNALMRELQASTGQIRKATGEKEREEAAESEALGLPHSPGGVAAGMNFPGLEEGGAKKAPEEARTPSRAEGEPAPNSFEAYAAKRSPLYTPQVIDLARKAYMGQPTGLLPHGPGARAVEQATRFLDEQVRRASNMQKLPNSDQTDDEFNQEKQNMVDQIVPGLGGRIEGLHKLQTDPASVPMKGDERYNLVDLTAKVWPGWKQGMYRNYWSDWANDRGQSARQVSAVNRASTSAVNLLAATNNLPFDEGDGLPEIFWKQVVSGTLGENPRYNAFVEALGIYAREHVTAETGRPGGAVSYVNQFLEKLNPRQGKAGIRAAVRVGINALRNQVEGLKESFAKQTGLPADQMPFYLPKTQELYDGIIRGNPYNGTVHKDAPTELQEVTPQVLDPEGKYRKKRPSWLDKNMEWDPMSQKEFDKREKYIRDHPDDPLSSLYKHELGIQR